jgi:hypothetical protein
MPLFRQRIVEAYHRRGARVLAFLPEHRHEVEAALELGVDEFLVNATAWWPDSE